MQPAEVSIMRQTRTSEPVVTAAACLLALTTPLVAQEVLTLRQAVDLALRSNPLVAAADAGEKEAEARIREAR